MTIKGQLPILLAALCAILATAASPREPDAARGAGARRYFVELEVPSLVAAARAAPGAFPLAATGRLDLDSAPARRHLERAETVRRRFSEALAAAVPSARVERTYGVLYGGVAVSGATAEELRRLPGVARVRLADTVRATPTLDVSLDAIDAEALWSSLGGLGSAGEGVRIAVIDSGIDIDNPMFSPSGFEMPPGYPRGQVAFTTNKVIAARAYFREGDPVDEEWDTPDPDDHVGHGSHCAGIAAGSPGTAFDLDGTQYVVNGVAPRAFLMSYKVFYIAESYGYEPGGALSPPASDVELMAAFEDAVADGADVITCSWGGPEVLVPGTPSEEVYRAAIEAGAVVVFAAGNEGDGAGSISYPGTIPDVLTVGSFSTGRSFSGIAGVLGPAPVPAPLRSMIAVRGAISPRFADAPVGPAPLVRARDVSADGSALGCDPFPEAVFDGAVAFIERGVCPFSTKVANAALAGAIAVIIYNDVAGALPVTMGGDAVTIPAVQIANPEGVLLDEFAEHHDGVEVEIEDTYEPYFVPTSEWIMAGSSSRGPTDTPVLKPEIAAPGVNVLSANAYPLGSGEPPWGLKSGTSMATPHVSGTAALVRQLHPLLGPTEVAALVVAASVTPEAAADLTTPLDRGAGYLNLETLESRELFALPSTISFGECRAGEELSAGVEIATLALAADELSITWIQAEAGHPAAASPPDGTAITAGSSVELGVGVPLGAPPGEYTGYVEIGGTHSPFVRIPYHYRVVPPVSHDLLILDLSFLPNEMDELAEAHAALAERAGLDYDVYRVEEWNAAPSLARLLEYEVVLAFTGEDQTESAGTFGRRTLDVLSTYMMKGGRVILAGMGPLRGNGHLRAFGLLGSKVADSYPLYDPYTLELVPLDEYEVHAVPGALPLGDAPFDIGPDNGGTGDLAFLGTLDTILGPGLPAVLTRPAIVMDAPVFAGGQGVVGAVFDPYPAYGFYPEVEGLSHRAAVLGFGLERVADTDDATPGRQDLFEALYDWVGARIDASLEVEQVGRYAIADVETSGDAPFAFTYDFGDGTTPLESGEARAYHLYEAEGEFQITVVVRSELGAADVARLTITVADEGVPPEPAADDDAGIDATLLPTRGVRDCACSSVGRSDAAPRSFLRFVSARLFEI